MPQPAGFTADQWQEIKSRARDAAKHYTKQAGAEAWLTGWPCLTGSPKQIAWARKMQAEAAEWFWFARRYRDEVATRLASREVTPDMTAAEQDEHDKCWLSALAAVECQFKGRQTAKDWIDNREEPPPIEIVRRQAFYMRVRSAVLPYGNEITE